MTTNPISPEVAQLIHRLKESAELSPEERIELERLVASDVPVAVSAEIQADPEPCPSANAAAPEEDIRVRIGKMSVPEKVKVALLGNSTCRLLLIRDPNRMVQLIVLQNPRLTPGEVEEFSKNSNLSDAVLRAIADNKNHVKSYTVKVHLVSNPKTPIDVSLKWLPHLRVGELRKLAKSKSVPQVIATAARKRVEDLDT